MRKTKPDPEEAEPELVRKIGVKELRAQLASIILKGQPVIVQKHRIPICVILPTGASTWEDSWDHALHVRTVRRHAAAVVKELDKD